MPEIDALARLIEQADQRSNGAGIVGPGLVDKVWEAVDDVARPELRDEADRVRVHLRAAVAARSVFARDCWATVLGGVAGAEAIADLIAAASADLGDDRDLLNHTLLTIVKQGPGAAQDPILKALRSDEATVRATAIWTLSFLPPEESIARAAAKALADPDPEVARMAHWALGGSRWSSLTVIAEALQHGSAKRR